MILCSTDSHCLLEGKIIWPMKLKMLKCHPITAFMKTYANFKQIFLITFFWFKYIFTIKFKIRILDLMLLPKNSVVFEGQYYSITVKSN